MENYSLQLIWSDQKRVYIATVPEIPQLSIVSETATQAVVDMHAAISVYLSERLARREPAAHPRRLEEFSGQFRLRLPRALHAALVCEAESEGVSLNTYILYLLGRRHAQQQALSQAVAAYGTEIRESLQFMHELVSSVTVSTPQTPAFSWQNSSSETITHIQ
ncbi:MAG: toxin-antitoxin system HicB family antitoxin [Pseudomonadota bacterium]